MAFCGEASSGREDHRPMHLPKEIKDKEWEETPTSVKNLVSQLNCNLECMKNFKSDVRRLTRQLMESKESLKARELAVSKLELEVTRLQEAQAQKDMEATVSQLELKLEGKEEERRISEEKAAALKLKLEESERKLKTSEEKTSEIQRELEKTEGKWREGEANAAVLQAKVEGVQKELEGVSRQLDDQVSESTKIIESLKEETERWWVKAVKFEKFIRCARAAICGLSDEELDKDDDISQDRLARLENTLKLRLQKGEENKKLLMGHYSHILKFATKVRENNADVNCTTENDSREAPNTDQPQDTPPPNSSPIQNSANIQPVRCVILNANNESAEKTDLNANMGRCDKENGIMNLVQGRESRTPASGHSFQDNPRSCLPHSSHEAPSPIASIVIVKQEPMDVANSGSEENARLNENTSNTIGPRIRPITDAPLNPSQPGSSNGNLRKRQLSVPSCNNSSSIKMMKASVSKATNSLRGRPIQSVILKKLVSFTRLQEEFPLLNDLQGPQVRRRRPVNFAKKRKYCCKFCNDQFDTLTQLNCHKKTVHPAAWVTPGPKKKGAKCTVNDTPAPQTTSSTPQGPRNQDPSFEMYGCIYCDNNYTHLSQLQIHVKNNHADKKYNGLKVRCGLCHGTYANGKYVRKHCYRVHKARP